MKTKLETAALLAFIFATIVLMLLSCTNANADEYKVVCSNAILRSHAEKDLNKQAKHLMLSGWTPLGGATISCDHSCTLCQAFIKEDAK